MPPSHLALRMISLGAFALLACGREPSNNAATKPTAKVGAAKPSASTRGRGETPAETMAKLGPIRPEDQQAHHVPVEPSKPLKTVGAIGEELEGDLSYFKLVSIRPCDDGKSPAPAGDAGAKDPKARKVVAAEVEIIAKRRLNVTPRDLMLGKGGIMIDPNMDLKREVKGCTPLLQVSFLQPKESTKGFVLFDLPTWGPGSNLNELNLVYHPARFGGAAQLYVKLAGG